jgi:hypothetical protein
VEDVDIALARKIALLFYPGWEGEEIALDEPIGVNAVTVGDLAEMLAAHRIAG